MSPRKYNLIFFGIDVYFSTWYNWSSRFVREMGNWNEIEKSRVALGDLIMYRDFCLINHLNKSCLNNACYIVLENEIKYRLKI